MEDIKMFKYIKSVIENMPTDWLNLTTHRLDIYDEKLAKVQFLEKFETLYNDKNATASALKDLPTAFDYIRLGHPLSSILEWTIGNLNKLPSKNVISFSSKSIPVFAVLRKNLLDNKKTQIVYSGTLPEFLNVKLLEDIYGYKFELKIVDKVANISAFDGSTIYISQQADNWNVELTSNIDFFVSIHDGLGSIMLINESQDESYISAIQHVRRRETIAMTPVDSLIALKAITENAAYDIKQNNVETNKTIVLETIAAIAGTKTKAVVGSSGLSIQYAIMMGLVHDAIENHKGKAIKIIVPPNCYGGTNDQARRVAASNENVEVMDLAVDGGHDMVRSIDTLLNKIASEDAIPYIIVEIPTNPRVEVPDLIKLKEVLTKVRKTATGKTAIDPVFILDQTFCPNVHFLGEGEILSTVRTISYASGSKFPSGGLVTSGYCVGNKRTVTLMQKIDKHLQLCDNEATNFQLEILAKQMPSMKQRINDAYKNTREFVNFIKETLPSAKIYFLSEELANKGFTPSVFSLDLPTKGNTAEEKEAYKRALNHELISLMIGAIPHESKYCVSYGQLKGCYWTIPATSTQGTTKEGDKDYVARVALSPNMDLDFHKKVFRDFVEKIELL